MKQETDSDEALVRRAGLGDRAAAAQLVERHTRMIYAASYRMLGSKAAAEDTVQETFLRLWRHAAKWKPQGAKFETWLYRVAMNLCLDQLRKAKREAPEDAAPERADGADRQDQKIFAAERRFAIDEALEKLPERQRLAITLCHYQELSNIEAAEIMAAKGVSCEVINLLSIRPLDRETIFNSIKKTGRCVTLEQGFPQHGVGAEIAAMIMETEVFNYLDAPMERVTGADVPTPYAVELEEQSFPQVNDVIAAIERTTFRSLAA